MGLVPWYHAALPDRRPGIIRIVAVNGTHRPPDALAPLINVRSGADGDKTTPNVTKCMQSAFGDIWCLFVSFGPAPHIYQRGERVGGPVCTIHGHYPESTWSSVRQGREVPRNKPHPRCLHIAYTGGK